MAEDSKTGKTTKTPWPLVTIGIFITVVIAALIMVSWLVMASLHYTPTSIDVGGRHMMPWNSERWFGGGSFDGNDDSGTAITRGVVTAIDGNTITVSGSGKQVKVMRTDSTNVSGGKEEVAVNDSVIILGDKKDDNTMEASRIVITNGSMGDNFWFHHRDSRVEDSSVPSV